MSAYNSPDAAIAGLLDGLNSAVISSKKAPTGVTVDFGVPLFVKAGDDLNCYLGDDADATLIFAGVAVRSPRADRTTQGEYVPLDMVNVLDEGRVWVEIPSGVTGTAHLPAYVIDDPDSANYGKFTSSSVGTYPTGGVFRTNPTGGLAILEVNGINAEDGGES